jgi:serine/threonine protein phosphatase 1
MITRRQLGEVRYSEAIELMKTFPEQVELDEALLVHGFFEPGVELVDQKESVIVGTMMGESYLEEKYERPWYELYDGDKPIVVGHHDYLGNGKPMIIKDRVFCIDTGCCQGRALTGLIIPAFEILSVGSRRNYWADIKAAYADIRLARTSDKNLTWQQMEEIVAASDRSEDLPVDVIERTERLRKVLAEGRAVLDQLYAAILSDHARVLEELKNECDFDSMTDSEQGSIYAKKIGSSPMGRFLHIARKGSLTKEFLLNRFRRPRDLKDYAQEIGLIDRASSAAESHRDSVGRARKTRRR